MSTPIPRTRVTYDLPATIKSIQTGWQMTFQSSAIISALFAVIESVLLFFFSSIGPDKLDSQSAGAQALFVFTYLAFFFSISATFSSLLLTDELGEIHVRASQRASTLIPLEAMDIHENTGELLKRYGARKTWKPVMWHWFIMLLLGYLSLVGQLLVYIWMMEPRPVSIAMSCVAGVSLLPLLSVFPTV
ncbi:hypothetical protein RhiJN_13706 [Ceratobasidium sp. AG-Ba]|nr:hypothetical protein RhiJN_13706 [Ceratobasidium sp. AG-Ba]